MRRITCRPSPTRPQPSRRASWESHLARPIRRHRITSRIGAIRVTFPDEAIRGVKVRSRYTGGTSGCRSDGTVRRQLTLAESSAPTTTELLASILRENGASPRRIAAVAASRDIAVVPIGAKPPRYRLLVAGRSRQMFGQQAAEMANASSSLTEDPRVRSVAGRVSAGGGGLWCSTVCGSAPDPRPSLMKRSGRRVRRNQADPWEIPFGRRAEVDDPRYAQARPAVVPPGRTAG